MSLVHKLQGAGGSSSALSLTYQGSVTTTSASTTFTYTSAPIGTAASNRLVIVVVGNRWGASSGGLNVTAVTVGGVSAVQQVVTTSPTIVSIWSAIVPTGTTANVVATYSAGPLGTSMSVYTIHGGASITAKTTAQAVQSGGINPISTTMNVTNKDIVIMGTTGDSATSGVTLVGVTENIEYNLTSGARGVYGAGSLEITATQSGRTFSATYGTTDRSGIAVASFNK